MGNRLKNNLERKLPAAALAIALGMGISACNNSEAAPVASPTTSETATPTEAPSPTATWENPDALTNELEKLPLNEFNSLPVEQRLKVVTKHMLDFNLMGGPTELFTGPTASGKRVLNYDPLMKSSPDNDGQTIMEMDAYMDQLAMAQLNEQGVDFGTLNQDLAKKMLSGAFYYVGDKSDATMYQSMLDIIDNNPTISGRLGYESPSVTSTSDKQQGVDGEGNPITYKDLVYTSAGNTWKERRVWVELPHDERIAQTGGVPNPGLWLFYSREKATQ